MLHKEHGAIYGVVDGTPTTLEDDMGRLTKIPPWKLGMVEIGDETDEVSLTIKMTMQ